MAINELTVEEIKKVSGADVDDRGPAFNMGSVPPERGCDAWYCGILPTAPHWHISLED